MFIVAGIALHERDAWHLQNRLHSVLTTRLPAGFNPQNFELHASDLKGPRPPAPGRGRPSEWLQIPARIRFSILRAGYQAISSYQHLDPNFPPALFGAVVTADYADRGTRAYEEVLNKFDEMLTRQGNRLGVHQTGIVVHDRRVLEGDLQRQADTWRHLAGRIGRLTHLADVPFFADSRATRLIQASDFVSWALWRYYGLIVPDEEWVGPLWTKFDADGGVMHGLIHVTPRFRAGCQCPPCASRGPAPGP